jgi:ABC-type hemin transport system substrate-binding protein
MKILEIDETETQLVIKVRGSSMAHVAIKDNAENMRDTLLAVLAEAPEEKPAEPEPEPEPIPFGSSDDGEDMGLEEAARTVLDAAGAIFKMPEVQKAKSLLERLPKSKRNRKSG